MPTRLLNEEQLLAIQHDKGPLLIIAGTGSGKTTVITERIKHLILDKKVPPSSILALTFTEKSAREMEERIDVAMPYGYTQLWISTFHAFCDRILRAEAIHIGLNPSYRLLTETEAVFLLRQNLFKFNLDYFRPLGNPTKFLNGMLQHFSRLSDEDITADEYLNYATTLKKAKDMSQEDIQKTLELAQAYKTYEKIKIQEAVMDFSNLIANTLKLFRTRPNILKQYQEQFEYILVDEFQDTNYAQNQLAILLAGEKKNITVVGDDDQAIYRWRGAAISNMIQFRETFPKAKVITLIKNYRSTEDILEKSYLLIQNNNPDRLEVKEKVKKKLISLSSKKRGKVELLFANRVEDEADMVVEKIKELTGRTYHYKDIAILVRANDHAQSFVRALARNNIPFQFLGPGQLFHQEEIKDLIAYLKVLNNYQESSCLYRVLSMPIFQLKGVEIATLLNIARRKNISLFEVMELLTQEKNSLQEENIFLKEETKKTLLQITTMIKRHLDLVPKESAGQILYYFLQDTGYLNKMLAPSSSGEERKFQNIAKFFDKLKGFEAGHEDASVIAVSDWIDLAMQMGESPLATDMDWSDTNAVNILTVHSSKGLEFPVVFIVNLVTQRFPVRERREQIPIPQELIKEILPVGDYHLQEERRLFYVAMTRAKEELYLTAAHYYGEGKRERKLSPFITEALGENDVSKIVHIQKEKDTAVQPSLLDWVSDYKQETKDKNLNALVVPALRNKITYLSYSQIQTFDMCPLHYKLRYILKIQPFTTPAQSFGTSIHAALRDFYTAWVQGEKISPKDADSFLKKAWISDGYDSKTHEQLSKKKAADVVSNYLTKYFKSDGKKPLALETPFAFFIEDKNKKLSMKLGGRIDRVDLLDDGRIEIIDYKTGNNTPSEKDLLTNTQLTMYALAANKVKDKIFDRKPENVILSLHYLEKDQKLSTARSMEQLEEAAVLFFQKADKIANSDYACSKSLFCENCEYKILCSTKS